MWSGLICVKVTPFCALNLGIKDVRARRRHWCKCLFVRVLLYLFCTIFMFERADSQQYVEVCTLLLCGWSNYYTACCLVWWLQLVYFSGPYLRVLGVILFEVCMLCFIVTFHVTTFDKGNRLVADWTHWCCAPHRQHKCIGYLSVHSLKFAIFGINFSFCVGFRARHNFRLLINRYRSQTDLPTLLPLTHTTCVTHRACGQHWVSELS